MNLFCATTNPGKLREFQTIAEQFGSDFVVDVLPDLRTLAPCEETGATFRENAIQKALYYSARSPGYLFADDSGLGDRRMLHQCALDFKGADQMARRFDHIVLAPDKPVISILILLRQIAG